MAEKFINDLQPFLICFSQHFNDFSDKFSPLHIFSTSMRKIFGFRRPHFPMEYFSFERGNIAVKKIFSDIDWESVLTYFWVFFLAPFLFLTIGFLFGYSLIESIRIGFMLACAFFLLSATLIIMVKLSEYSFKRAPSSLFLRIVLFLCILFFAVPILYALFF